MFGEIASRNVYLMLSTSIINWCNISALLDVEKTLRWETPLSKRIMNLILTISICRNSDVCIYG